MKPRFELLLASAKRPIDYRAIAPRKSRTCEELRQSSVFSARCHGSLPRPRARGEAPTYIPAIAPPNSRQSRLCPSSRKSLADDHWQAAALAPRRRATYIVGHYAKHDRRYSAAAIIKERLGDARAGRRRAIAEAGRMADVRGDFDDAHAQLARALRSRAQAWSLRAMAQAASVHGRGATVCIDMSARQASCRRRHWTSIVPSEIATGRLQRTLDLGIVARRLWQVETHADTLSARASCTRRWIGRVRAWLTLMERRGFRDDLGCFDEARRSSSGRPFCWTKSGATALGQTTVSRTSPKSPPQAEDFPSLLRIAGRRWRKRPAPRAKATMARDYGKRLPRNSATSMHAIEQLERCAAEAAGATNS